MFTALDVTASDPVRGFVPAHNGTKMDFWGETVVSEQPQHDGQPSEEGDLFEDIRRFLSEQSGDDIYEDFRAAFQGARGFVNRELRDMEEYGRMVRTLERLLEDEFPDTFSAPLRARLAEMLYIYGLAHYSLLQQSTGDEGEEAAEAEEAETARPLVIYDLWFPQDVAIEQAQDGYYLHLSDGRIDLSLYLGSEPNERGALVDLVDHWGYAAANTPPGESMPPPGERITPVLTVELDYGGSEMVDAEDHVDILFLDNNGEPIVRMHARSGELRTIVDELQNVGHDDSI